jgi:hypothetical protein
MDLVKIVKAHALANYEKGWDVWIETMTRDEQAEVLKNCRTDKGAIKKAWDEIKDYVAYRAEVQSTEW